MARTGFSSSPFAAGLVETGPFGFSKQTRGNLAVARPAVDRPFSARPVGPREFADRVNPALADAPNSPPPGFVSASTSGSEWVVYWSLAKIFGDPKGEDVRRPPFYGARDSSVWRYQYGYGGGGGPTLGKATVDFVVSPFNLPILIRLQTEHFHVFVDPKKHLYDKMQAANISKYGKVVDLYEQDFMYDPTGQQCIVQCQRIIKGQDTLDVLKAGTATRIHVPKPGGRHG